MNASHHHCHGATAQSPVEKGARLSTAFAVGILLNVGIVVLQAVFGIIAHSSALLADAGHNLGDVLSLVVAGGAAFLSMRPPNARYTYGLRSSSIFAALFNALFLMAIMGGIAWQAVRRLAGPVPVEGGVVMAVAAIAVLVNGLTAWLFASRHKRDINVRGAFLHMATDALISLGVVVSGGLNLLTGWLWIDPAVTLIIIAIVVYGTWGLLHESMEMALAAVPRHVDSSEVRAWLRRLPGVSRVHDLHIWPMSTTQTALTCHLVIPGGHPGDTFTVDVARSLHEKFGIEHTTVQIEINEEADCRLRMDESA